MDELLEIEHAHKALDEAGVPELDGVLASRIKYAFGGPQPYVTIEHIIQRTCGELDMPEDVLYGECRRTSHVNARQIVMYLARSRTDMSNEEIGKVLGGRTHATVIHGVRKMVQKMRKDRNMRIRVAKIERSL